MKMGQTIPTYRLYGEEMAASMPELVHCEQIIERSRLHDWHILPHKHTRLFQLLLVQQGRAVVSLDGESHALFPHQAIGIAPGVVHGFDFDPGSDGLVITMDEDFLEPIFSRFSDYPVCLSQVTWFRNAAEQALPKLFECLRQSFREATPGNMSLVSILAEALFAAWVHETQSQLQRENNPRDRAETHFYKFEKLVNEQFATQKHVSWYARQLGVSPEHLNVICHQVAGTAALNVIHQRVVLEARRLLVYTRLNVSQVAEVLGYRDPAYFSRFFKKKVGVPPKDFHLQSAGASEP
ncbi:helix-turn-helix domain-containing protein [Gynuella sp.]|uniref:helix-turn-helix domain-containing protein n=1 Tax=Gynuella sp. TaxID=2969146 RepID=UPI003D0CA7A1